MSELNVVIDEPGRTINVTVSDIEPIDVCRILKVVLETETSDRTVTPTWEVQPNHTEATEYQAAPEDYPAVASRPPFTRTQPRGTIVMCDVHCPECNEKYEKSTQTGYPVICRMCKSALFCETSVNGRYKAVKLMERKK